VTLVDVIRQVYSTRRIQTPLLCPGITTFNALRHSGAMPGDLVAVQGIGGLGHLGIQFASKFGYKVGDGGSAWTTMNCSSPHRE